MALSQQERKELIRFIRSNQLNIKSSTGWTNYSKFRQNKEALVLDIDDTESLSKVLQFITALNKRKDPAERTLVRPAAGGRGKKYSESYSVHGVEDTDIVIRLVGKEFTEIKGVDKEEQVVTIGASMQVGEINQQLYDHYNLTLPTSSLNPYISFIGLAANSGIGTGKDQPGVAGLIKSMKLCLPNGEIVTIDSSHPDFETICSGHQGLFGFVLSAEVQCIEAQKLECNKEVMSVAQLIDEIKQGLFERDPYTSIYIMPTYQADELTNRTYKNVCVYRWRPVEKTCEDQNARTPLTHVRQEMETRIYDYLNISNFLCQYPHVIPQFAQYIVLPLVIGSKNETSVSRWYDSVHHQTGYPGNVEDTGLLFEVSEDCHEIVAALEKVFTTLHEYSEQDYFPITSGMYLRYLQGMNGGVSITQHADGKHVCSFDMVSDIHNPGHDAFQKEITEFFRENLKAVPHLGKFLPDDYQLNCAEYNDALVRWYEENNLNLEESMLLTAHYCKLLQFPKMMPAQPDCSRRQFALFQPAENLPQLRDRVDDEPRYKAAM
ncbi:FAD-binding protein [Fluoribacter gormanii]|uniref:FAD binding domain-containing protein n=1 Tax=Fluoribacter gormanii TaxID=464 RepID=A0A377GNP7_9GAMM|nr:FAD-binding protein [Fluoribacter gormanii]KTD04120.1 L-gulono-gamma-lactone oxidase [Fluoribacter gormanii]MCW8445505.1 FAD-binding protein [Fluoribacter gormanii]SIR88258.1 FAD binding domain-containing protein [Fluoribacter gormanii]STO26125.1 sugar 1,4-lactone oxidases [Fluoribacter gormanii]